MKTVTTQAVPKLVAGARTRRVNMPKKPVFQVINYVDLKTSSDSLHEQLHYGFGEDGQGAVIIRNIPGLWEARTQLSQLSFLLANQQENELKKLECSENNFQRGWSSKHSHIYNISERNIGMFRAHLSSEDKYRLRTSQVELLPKRVLKLVGDNVWPVAPELKHFKKAFLEYHSLVKLVGIELLLRVEKYIEQQQPYFRTAALSQLLKRSDQHVGNMNFSYPQVSYEQLNSDWDSWNVDSALLQGISSQVYLDRDGNEQLYTDLDAGVHVLSKQSKDYMKIRVDDSSILFKAGEALQILSGGAVYARPYRVIRGHFLQGKDLSIEGCSTIIQPNLEEKLAVPSGVKTKTFIDSLDGNNSQVPSLSERWEQGMTYGAFLEKTISANVAKSK